MEVTLDYIPKRQKCKIYVPDEGLFENLRFVFSTPNLAKRFVKGDKGRFIDDRTYFITAGGQFHFGIAEMIIKWLQENTRLDITFKFSEAYLKRFAKDETPYELVDNLKLSPRDYQRDVIKLALHHGFGTFVMGTGAGKTLTISCILNNLFHYKKITKALIIVPDNGLVTQFEDELCNQYGMTQKIALFYDKKNKIDPEADIIIANRPLFLARFDQNKEFFTKTVDCLIVDEAHSIKRSNKVSACIEQLTALYRFGFTGTLAEAKEDKFKNLGVLGPVRYEITSKDLRDSGFLSDVTIHQIRLAYSRTFAPPRYREEVEFLQLLEPRNQFLTKLCFKLKNNTLLLVNFLAHGFALEKMFNEHNDFLPASQKKKVYFIRGEVANDVRDQIKKLMEKEDNIICIAITKIFSTGINIKNLHHVVLAAGGKSSVTVVQSIGRGLRLHPNKKQLNIWDISDKGYKYSVAHAERRRQIYDVEKIRVEFHDVRVS